jgi:esterase/lipase superfamily enzyme
MRKEVHRWYSSRIGKEMPIAVYGHYGFPLLMFPTAAADFEEYERFHLLNVMKPWIDAGKVKVYSIDSVNAYTWMNTNSHPAERARKHEFYDGYVTNEVVPFIWNNQGHKAGIITTGASMGAYHAMNFLLKHPDIFDGTIAMSGAYDMTPWTKGYVDANVYLNSPMMYLPNLHDSWYLDRLRAKKHIHILTGTGDYEAPEQSRRLARDLWAKGIPANLDVWGRDMPHDWTTWRKMMPLYLENAF